MKDIGYTYVSVVVETWDAARFNNKNFDDEFGVVAFKRLFQLRPNVKPRVDCCGSTDIQNNVAVYAKSLAGFVDSIIQMLGPDTDFMESILGKVSTSFQAMGGRPLDLDQDVGEALCHAVQQSLGRALTDEERNAFDVVYKAISAEIHANIKV